MKMLIVIGGAPGVGKSTLGNKFKQHGWNVYDLDDYRWIIPQEAMDNDKVVIIDTYSRFEAFPYTLSCFPDYIKSFLYMKADIDTLMYRQFKRGRYISKQETLEYMLKCDALYHFWKRNFNYNHVYTVKEKEDNINYNRSSSDN